MSFLLLIHEPVGQRAERTPSEGQAAYDSMLASAGELRQRDLLLAVESLAGTEHAARVQVRGGRTQVIDGPFVEAKEMVGGFFLLNCKTREEALAIAARCPAAAWATVEVRATAPCNL